MSPAPANVNGGWVGVVRVRFAWRFPSGTDRRRDRLDGNRRLPTVSVQSIPGGVRLDGLR